MLEIKEVSKSFPDVKAVDNVSVTIYPGEILGLIGQNGAGKTTLFRLILKLLKMDSGKILWNGEEINEKVLDQIGFLPEERGLYPKRKIEDQILFFAELRGKKRSEIAGKIDDWFEDLQVKGKKTDKIKTLSKGNQQQVQLICTLIHEPKLIILDEPFSGLDPVNAGLLAKSIKKAKERGACIIFSSHNMENVTDICDKVLMLKNGRNVLSGTVKDVRDEFPKDRVFVETDLYDFDELLGLEGVVSGKILPSGTTELIIEQEEYGKALFRLLSRDGYIKTFSQQSPDLDEIFRMKVGEADA